MTKQKFSDIFDKSISDDAIINNDFNGFQEDYLVLHCLLRKQRNGLKTFLEIGTNMGVGTKIIKNALGDNCRVYSLDLPTELAHISLQHPINEKKGDAVGSRCDLPFIQLRGDSMKYNYESICPIDGWFIDGEHDYEHPYHESTQAFRSGAKLVVWHDADIDEVWRAITDAHEKEEMVYDLFRVTDTRIAYAIKK